MSHQEDNNQPPWTPPPRPVVGFERDVWVGSGRPAPTQPNSPQRLWLSATLFAATFISAMWSQAVDWTSNESLLQPLREPSRLIHGLPFALTLMTILLAHEMGHYLEARRLGVDHSLPYFIPAPTFFGTLGAVIMMRSRPASRSVLLRVALAGPYTGLLVAIPAVAWGLAHSHAMPAWRAMASNEPMMGASLLFHFMIKAFAPKGDFYDLHQVALAGWVGLFVTSLNLIPASQLDGGHVLYTLFPRRHRRLALGVVLASS